MFKLTKRDIIIFLKFVVVMTIVGIIFNLILEDNTDWNDIREWIFYNFYFGGVFSYGNTVFNRFLDKLFPWDDNPKRRVLWGVICSVIFNVLLLIVAMCFLVAVIKGQPVADAFSKNYAFTYVLAFLITVITSLIVYSVAFFKEIQEQNLVNEKLRKEKVQAELNTLKAQVNPHFLFNNFNVLSGLIEEDPDKAQKFLGGLSKIYRYVLEQRNEDLTTLSEELSFAKQYMELHQTRFENNVRMEVSISEEQQKLKIPSLSLQLLLENAIKHNAFDAEQPLVIKITGDESSLQVSNNMKKRKQLNGTSGMGLENIRERYKLRGVEGFEVSESAGLFTVNLPLV